MAKQFSRILIFLLIPGLLLDPSSAGAFSTFKRATPLLTQELFSTKAFINREIETRGTFAKGLRAIQLRLERQVVLQASKTPVDPRAVRQRNRLWGIVFLVMGIVIGGVLQVVDVSHIVKLVAVIPSWEKWGAGLFTYVALIAVDLVKMHLRIRHVHNLTNSEFRMLVAQELQLLGLRLVSADIDSQKREMLIQDISKNTTLFHPIKKYFSYLKKIYLWCMISSVLGFANYFINDQSTFAYFLAVGSSVFNGLVCLISSLAFLRLIHKSDDRLGASNLVTGQVEIHPSQLRSELSARITMTHEGVHAFEHKKLIKSDRVASSADILRLAELIGQKTDAPVLSQKWREQAESAGFSQWADLEEGNHLMRNLLSRNETALWRSIKTLDQTRTTDLVDAATKENYSASMRIGGMAVALFKQYPPDPSDPTGGKPWAFLRGLANGQSLSEALIGIGIPGDPMTQKPQGPIAHWDFGDPISDHHDPRRGPHFEQDQQQKLDETATFQRMAKRKSAETERVQKAKADIAHVLESPLTNASDRVSQLDQILRAFLDIKQAVFIAGRQTNSLWTPKTSDRPLATLAEMDSLSVFLWHALAQQTSFMREIGDFSSHLKMLLDSLIDENHLVFVTGALRRLIGSDVRRQLMSEAAGGVAIARHIRSHGMHFLSFHRPIDHDLLVETVRLFIPLLLALPEEQWEEEWPLSWSHEPYRLKFGPVMLWSLAEMVDVRLYDFTIYMFGDRANKEKPRQLWQTTDQAITESLIRMVTDLDEVNAFGQKTGNKISPQKVGTLVGKIMSAEVEWPGLIPPGEIGDGAPGSMCSRLLKILRDDARPVPSAFFNMALFHYGDCPVTALREYAHKYGSSLDALKKFLLKTPELHAIAQAA